MMLLPNIIRDDEKRRAERYRELLRREAKIGGQLFGPIPKGHERQFFCLDRQTWVWHEEWNDKNGKRHVVTTRYTVRPGNILKSQDGNTYQRVEKHELRNLYQAAKLYRDRVTADLHHLLQQTA